jgi:DNA-binding IclR family transcriptional regulator
MAADLDALLSSLAVPAEFARYDDLDDANVLVKLDRWKTESVDAAVGLRHLLLSSHNGKATVVELPLGDRARVAAAASSLVFENEWTTEVSRLRCQGESARLRDVINA